MASDDYEGLGTPFGDGPPTGTDLRADPEGLALYRRIKDARSAARAEDKSSEAYVVQSGEPSEDAVNRPSERWRDVHDLALEALSERTKDIELFAWLAEAAVRLRGLTALAGVVGALRRVVVEHFEDAYPIDELAESREEMLADKAVPLAGLNGTQDSDGTLIRPLRLCSLFPGEIYGRLSLWEHTLAQRGADGGAAAARFGEAMRATPPVRLAAMRAEVDGLGSDIAAIDAHLTQVCGADAPSLRRIRGVIEDIALAYNELGVPVAAAGEVSEPDDGNADATDTLAPAAASAPPPRKGIQDREQAFGMLTEVAAFFRRTEPHSPVPPALETIVRRGRMDFAGLMTELVPDEHQRQELLKRFGIEPGPQQ